MGIFTILLYSGFTWSGHDKMVTDDTPFAFRTLLVIIECLPLHRSEVAIDALPLGQGVVLAHSTHVDFSLVIVIACLLREGW